MTMGNLRKTLGLPLDGVWQRLLAVRASSGCLPVPRGPRLAPWLAGSLVLSWPSSAFAQNTGVPVTPPSTPDSAPADPYVVGGLIFAAVLICTYIALRAIRRHEWPDVGDVVSIVATSTAITAGIRLAVVAISADELGPFVSEDRVFIPLAGLALVLVSTKAIYLVMRDGVRAPD